MLNDEDRDRHFPSLREMVYLNTAAEGIPPVQAGEALKTYHEHKVTGMSGRESLFAEFESCRRSAADLVGVGPEEVSFCSSASEAYNLLATAIDFQPGDEVVVADLDFPAGATPWLHVPGARSVRLWRNRDGVLELENLAELLNEKTRLVQVSLVSFLTGFRIDWSPFRDLVRRQAPNALLAVDVTQAVGRVALDCLDADCLFASSYKWLLGGHGGCLVVVPSRAAGRVTVRAGGWYHLANAFDADRFTRAAPFPGARGFAVGMPGFPAVYALRAGIDCLREAGVSAIADHANRLVARLHEGLSGLGIRTMSPAQAGNSSGIVAFQTEDDETIHRRLLERNIHVMHQAGRIRVSVHGYNRESDVDAFLAALESLNRRSRSI